MLANFAIHVRKKKKKVVLGGGGASEGMGGLGGIIKEETPITHSLRPYKKEYGGTVRDQKRDFFGTRGLIRADEMGG